MFFIVNYCLTKSEKFGKKKSCRERANTVILNANGRKVLNMTVVYEIVSIVLQVLQIIEYIVRITGLIWPDSSEETA